METDAANSSIRYVLILMLTLYYITDLHKKKVQYRIQIKTQKYSCSNDRFLNVIQICIRIKKGHIWLTKIIYETEGDH